MALGRLTPTTSVLGDGRAAALGRLAHRTLAAFGVRLSAREHALHLVDRSAERHALDKLVGLVGGGAGGLVLVTGLGLVGIVLPAVMLGLAVVAFAVGGFVLPDLALADEAAK